MRKLILIGAAAALILGATSPTASASLTTAASPTARPATASTVAATATGAYAPVKPARILDTRSKNGVPGTTSVGAAKTVALQVTGRGGVPASGVSAVVLNLTTTSQSSSGYLIAYPAGQSRPSTSSLNFARATTRANLVTVPIGSGGKVNIFNGQGSTHVIADVQGYYLSGSTTPAAGTFGSYQPLTPTRLLDTRSDGAGRLEPGDAVPIPFDLSAADNPHVTAVAVNITSVSSTGNGFLTAWNGDQNGPPSASTLNYTKGQVTPNMAIVPVSDCPVAVCGSPSTPFFGIYNHTSAASHVVVDVVGYYDDNSSDIGLRFKPLSPTRIVDSRVPRGIRALGAGQTKTVITPASVAGPDSFALVSNVTAVAPSANTVLTFWGNDPGQPRPSVSNLNPAQGSIVANMAIIGLGENRDFNVWNSAGTTNVVVDVTGTMDLWFAAGAAPAVQPQGSDEQRRVVPTLPVHPAPRVVDEGARFTLAG